MKRLLMNACLCSMLLLAMKSNAQVIDDSILIDGHYRTFHFTKPESTLKNGSLLFALHGSGGNGLKTMKNTRKLQAVANEEQLLIVCPDGYKKHWNECRKEVVAAANTENIDDNAFFIQMIDYFVSQYGIDKKKVFVVGTSGGGHMAYKLAFTLPEKIRAITAIVANIPATTNMDCVEKRKAIPVMIINGTSDSTNPYNGGFMKGKGLVQATEASFHYWADLAGYKGTPTMEALPDNDPSDGKTIERYTFKEKGKPEIVLLKVINGVHGTQPKDIDVYTECWSFFKRQL